MAKSTMTFDEALDILQSDVDKCAKDVLEKAINVVKDQEPNHPALAAAQNALDATKNTVDIDDALVYSANINDMEARLNSYSYDDFINDSNNSDIKSYVDIVDIIDNSGNKTGHSHQGKKSAGLQGYRLTAGVRTRNDQSVVFLAYADIDRNDLVLVN